MAETRVAVITGASSGIGKAAAKALAAEGWRVIGVGREPNRCAAAADEIRGVCKGGSVEMLRADLASLADTERLAGEIAALTDRIHVLINNAGGMAKAQSITPEGLEANFAANHLGPFLLTKRLLPLLRRAAAETPEPCAVRVLNTSSDASEMIPGLDFDDLQGLQRFNSGAAYCRSKLANVLFAKGLAHRLAEDGIAAHAVHPGYVESNFINGADEHSQATMRAMKGKTPEEGADTLVWLALGQDDDQATGGYFFERTRRPPNPVAEDIAYVDRLWAESEKLLAAAGH